MGIDSEMGWGTIKYFLPPGGLIWLLQHSSRPEAEWKDGQEVFPYRSMGPEESRVHNLAWSYIRLYYIVCFKS